MRRAAIGIRVHSGWGALVAVSMVAGAVEFIDRRRVAVTDPGMRGASQPYHSAEQLEIHKARKYLDNCTGASARLAVEGISDLVQQLERREFQIVGSGILLGSGRPLPSLGEILASHAMIHAAEGELFRNVFRGALEQLQIPVVGFRERDLSQEAKAVFGSAAPRIQRSIAALGRSVGPPWTSDQKTAALAACIVLAGKTTKTQLEAVHHRISRTEVDLH
jgi:hypothetical protein